MVSREFRSPVEVIEESIDLVLQGLVGGITSAQKDILSTAKSNIDRLGRLINDVLDFQKMEAGKMEFDIKENDLNEVILATSKEMNILAEEKGLNFTVNIDEMIPHVKFDKDKIAQVLINLLSNAIKFTAKGGVFVEVKHEENIAHIMVRDTGPGISSEAIPALFQTVGKDRGDINKGASPSLGLAICNKIILAHKGKMWVESQPGKGATFHFTLPVKERRS
jgi:signal transduction histidine kinase